MVKVTILWISKSPILLKGPQLFSILLDENYCVSVTAQMKT